MFCCGYERAVRGRFGRLAGRRFDPEGRDHGLLAAVIGSFVLNLGGSLQRSAPGAGFAGDHAADGAANDTVGIAHETGDSTDPARPAVTVPSSTAISRVPGRDGDTVSAGNAAN